MASSVRPKFEQLKLSDSGMSNSASYYPLRMTVDKRTEMYVKFAKIMLIFQGPLTDERRHAVEELSSTFKYACRVVSDETYRKETSRFFSAGNTGEFFSYFRNRVKKSCEDGYNLIIINQSVTNSVEIQYYFFLAQTMQYQILPYPPLVSQPFEWNAKKNTQAAEIKLNFQGNLFRHLFCGFFLHDVDSAELREEANLYVQDCFDIPEFKDLFSEICEPSDFAVCYNMVNKRQNLAFSPVKILQSILDAKTYMTSEAFVKFYGSMSKLYVVGFIISPHMIAARIRLTHEQRKLWEMRDDLDESKQVSVFPSELLKKAKVHLPKESVTLIASKCNRTIIAGDPICAPTESINSRAKGRTCHIVLGRVNDAPPRNVDYDVPFAVCREINVLQKHANDVRPYELDRSLVRRIGKYWFIYMKETLIVNGLFATCCAVEN